jgi:hypothetical protein
MTSILATIYRAASVTASIPTLLIGTAIIYDGITGLLTIYYRVITFVAGFFFLSIGAMILGLERSLARIRRYMVSSNGQNPPQRLNAAWRVVYLCLTAIACIVFLVMCLAMIGIVDRMRQGVTIFG